MILFLLNVLLPNTIIWTLSQNKALWRLEITAMIGKIKKTLSIQDSVVKADID